MTTNHQTQTLTTIHITTPLDADATLSIVPSIAGGVFGC